MENTNLIEKALAYIQSSRSESGITIDDVAFHAGFSTDYFNRIFQSHTGFTVMEYIRFNRLKRASILLRSTDRDILDIAMECGYEAHESFSRAFRKQYGKTPSEYRAYYADLPITYADAADDVAAARFVHEFPQFKRIDSTDAMDMLLERDARRFGVTVAEIYAYNGTRFFTDEQGLTSAGGVLLALDEFGTGNTSLEVISDDLRKVAEIWKAVHSSVKYFAFNCLGESIRTEQAEIERAFREAGAGDATIKLSSTQYTGGSGKKMYPARDEMTIRPLTIDDVPAIRTWAVGYGNDWKVEETITQRNKYHNAPYDLPFGVFMDDKLSGERLVGVCRTNVYEYHGVAVGEIEGIAMLREYSCRENDDHIFSVVLEELIAREYLPTCMVTDPEIEAGELDPEKFGFTVVQRVYGVE